MLTAGEIAFVREHLEDDVHVLLLAADKYPGKDVQNVSGKLKDCEKSGTKYPNGLTAGKCLFLLYLLQNSALPLIRPVTKDVLQTGENLFWILPADWVWMLFIFQKARIV